MQLMALYRCVGFIFTRLTSISVSETRILLAGLVGHAKGSPIHSAASYRWNSAFFTVAKNNLTCHRN